MEGGEGVLGSSTLRTVEGVDIRGLILELTVLREPTYARLPKLDWWPVGKGTLE